MKVRQLCYAAMLAALTAVCTQIAIPTPWQVPFTLSTLAVFLSGTLLGAKWGTIAQAVYLLIGMVGVPVFSGFQGGLHKLVGPTGGYLIGYLFAAFLTGWFTKRSQSRWMPPVAMVFGLAVCYAFGTAWFMYLNHASLASALGLCVVPYLIPDALKITAATLITWHMGALRFAESPERA